MWLPLTFIFVEHKSEMWSHRSKGQREQTPGTRWSRPDRAGGDGDALVHMRRNIPEGQSCPHSNPEGQV